MKNISFDEYLESLLGKREKNKLLKALKGGLFIVITGPHGATGKTTLCRVLRERGYNVVEKELHTHEVCLTEPLKECIRDFKDTIF